MDRKIITISGSYRFRDMMMEAYHELTKWGHLVWLPDIPDKNAEGSTPHSVSAYLTHIEKIRRSDILVVICPKMYIGASTRVECSYAMACQIPTFFAESIDDLLEFHDS